MYMKILLLQEIFPEKYRYQSEPACMNAEAENMAGVLIGLDSKRTNMELDMTDIEIANFSIEQLKPLYSAILFSG